MITEIKFELSYTGNEADRHELDFYDAAEALIGFQRSLALTTHLILNGEIIVQAPSLKGAKIMVAPPEAGSWKINATILTLLTGFYYLGTAPRDTPLGNLVSSAYDYLISESLGFHVDYNKTLGQQAEELKKQAVSAEERLFIVPTESQMDSLAEKCETAIKQIHRPIIGKRTAQNAKIHYLTPSGVKATPTLTEETYLYMNTSTEGASPTEDIGRVSSYNTNTYKGRIYSLTENRPIPFEVAEDIRDENTVNLIISSLQENARNNNSQEGYIAFTAYRSESKAGALKGLFIISIRHANSGEVMLYNL